jgi:pilus assembly protein Flp/PilA
MERLRNGLLKSYTKLRGKGEGQALAEYALIIGLIAVVCIVALGLLGNNISSALSKVAACV